MATTTASTPATPQIPGMATPNTRTFGTGIPGLDILSGIASGNVKDLLQGTESPAITQNMNAQWGAGSGMAPGSEFLRNRAVDLYGQRGAARKEQGLNDLLQMLNTYSGTVTARPGDVLSSESQAANRSLEAARINQSGRNQDQSYALQAANFGSRNLPWGSNARNSLTSSVLGKYGFPSTIKPTVNRTYSDWITPTTPLG